MHIPEYEKYDEGTDGIIYRLDNARIIKRMKYNPQIDILPSIVNELILLNNLDHHNIIKMEDIYCDTEYGYIDIVMPYKGEPLLSYLFYNKLEDREKDMIIMELLLVIEYLHGKKYVHGDLSLKNILIQKKDNKYQITLIDFSTTTKFQRYYRSNYYPTDYVCPYELLDDKLFDLNNPKSTDIFSLGCILYYIITGVPLFCGTNKNHQYTDIREKLINKKDTVFEKIKDHYLCKIIKKMIQINPKKRLTINKIIGNYIIQSKMASYGYDKIMHNEIVPILKKYPVDINLKIELIETILQFCMIKNISYETIYLTINNLSQLKSQDFFKGIILFWLSINIIENIYISVDDISTLLRKKINHINKNELLKKKINMIKKFKYKIDNITVYQDTYNLNISVRKIIIKDTLTIISFTDNIMVDINNINIGRNHDQIKNLIVSGDFEALNHYNRLDYNDYNKEKCISLINLIEKVFQ